jgi:1-acyl-sn-glycerol-3-phosphate acyltransferase
MGERDAGQLYSLARLSLGPAVRFLWRVHLVDIDHVPVRGGAILAPNHISFLDSAFLLLRLPRRITFVGKAEYLDDWKTKYLFPAVGMIPIQRGGGGAGNAALDAATRVIERGELFGIFPEGTRSRSGDLHKGHTGVARLALRTGAPIIPVGIIGTDHIQPPGASLPRPFLPATIRFGRPIDPGRYRQRAEDRMVLRQLTDEVMFEVRALTGQRYVDHYATRTPDAIPPELAPVGRTPRLVAVG